METNNGYLTVEQVAEMLQVHQNTVYRWLENGKMKGALIGGTWRIRKLDIDAFFDQKPTEE
jgi:excisionase family DNA binding protein